MSDRWIEKWSNRTQNAEITAGASESFGISESDQANRRKYGSMNTLFLTNRSDSAIAVYLDGNIYTELFSQATLVIEADDGLYFDLIKVVELDSATITAGQITIRYGRNILLTR